MRWIVVVILAAGCGRIDFGALDDAGGGDARGDARGVPGDVAIDAPDAGPQGIALVQVQNNSTSATSISATFAQPVAAGDVVIVGLDYFDPGNATLSDSAANGYTTVLPVTSTVPGRQMLAYAVAATTGPLTVTAQFDASVGCELRLAEFTGLATTNTYDSGTSTQQPATAGTVVLPTLTTSAANELVFEYVLIDAGLATAGAGWMTASGYASDLTEYQIAATPTTIPPTVMLDTPANYGAWGAVFRGR